MVTILISMLLNPHGLIMGSHLYLITFILTMGELQYLSPIGRCHHALLQFSVDFNPNPVQKFCRTVWKYSNADWEKANDCLSSFQLDQNEDVDCARKCFHDMFMQTMSECIPQKLSSCKAVTPPWLTAELRK